MGIIWPILTAPPVPLLESPAWLILAAFGIPAAVTGLLFRRLEKSIERRDKQRDREQAERERKAEERERNREKLDMMLLQSTSAAIALGEATAKAVQRIPDAHCNGDMHAALDYAARVKHEQKDFLTGLGIHALHDE